MYLRCDGQLTVDPNGAVLCDQWVQLTEEQLAQTINAASDGTVLLRLYELLELAFSVPEPTDLAAVWMAGFSLPVICWLVSGGYGTVINFLPNKG